MSDSSRFDPEQVECREWKDGDVIRYERSRTHCREGLAVYEGGNFFDTYWSSNRHMLTAEEVASAEFRFNRYEFEPFTGGDDEWLTYREEDRGYISSQRGLQSQRFIRPGSTPDYDLELEAAEWELEKAKTALTSAEWTVERREADLEALKNRGAIEIKAADTAPTSSTTAPITNYREETE